MPRNNADKIVGLAMRAGKIVSGETACENAVRDGSAVLLILSEDASANTTKKFTDKCNYYSVPLIKCFTKKELGKSMGKEERAIAAFTDPGLAELFKKKLGETVD